MFKYFYKQNTKFLYFQLKNKLLKNHYYHNIKVKKCYVFLDILNQKINSPIILKYLLLLELLFGNKIIVKNYLKKYKFSKINLFKTIILNNFYYFYFLLKFFYIPLLKRQNLNFSLNSFDKDSNYIFLLKNINFFPFIFNSFFFFKI